MMNGYMNERREKLTSSLVIPGGSLVLGFISTSFSSSPSLNKKMNNIIFFSKNADSCSLPSLCV